MTDTQKKTYKNKKKNEIDMLHGPLAGKILAVALPLAAISVLQQFFNAADVAVVGRFASSESMAAVGTNTPIVNLFITFFTGLSTGGNVAISTAIGRGEPDKVRKAVKTVFTMSLVSALIVLVLGQIVARPFLLLLDAPANILDKALLYLRIYLFAMAFAVVYNFASAVLRSKGDTKRPLYCLIASGVLNVVLNVLFVVAFRLDVAGVALATLISNAVCADATVYLLLREELPFRISFADLGIDREALGFTLRIGLPTGIQSSLFSLSNMFIQSAINSFGPACIAGNTAATNFEFISYFIVAAFAQTCTTFTSQNYGAADADRCRRVFRDCILMGVGLSFTASMIFFFGRNLWLGFFTTEAAVITYGGYRMTFVVMLEWLTGFNEMPAAGLRGMGISIPPMIITIMGSCVFRILWINTAFRMFPRIEVLMMVYSVSWMLISIFMTSLYFKKRKSMLAVLAA